MFKKHFSKKPIPDIKKHIQDCFNKIFSSHTIFSCMVRNFFRCRFLLEIISPPQCGTMSYNYFFVFREKKLYFFP